MLLTKLVEELTDIQHAHGDIVVCSDKGLKLMQVDYDEVQNLVVLLLR